MIRGYLDGDARTVFRPKLGKKYKQCPVFRFSFNRFVHKKLSQRGQSKLGDCCALRIISDFKLLLCTKR